MDEELSLAERTWGEAIASNKMSWWGLVTALYSSEDRQEKL